MVEVLFYHLERGGAGDVLPGLLERSVDRGWTCVVRCRDAREVQDLDARLWTYSQESFLPHGAGPADPRQPIWLTETVEIPEGRDVLFALGPDSFAPEALGPLTRAVLMFADGDAPAAREAWKRVKAAGLDATYWKQDGDGRWQKAG